jgi:hypothetical protein
VTEAAPPPSAAANAERETRADDAIASAPTGSRRSWLLLALALAVLMIGVLTSPRVPHDRQREFCVTNVPIAGPFSVSMVCDSHYFMQMAREPLTLLEPMNQRQARPGLILAAAAIAWPLSPFANLAQTLGIRPSRPDVDQKRIDNALAKDFSAYAAYIILNVFIVLMSFHLFRLICGPPQADLASIAIFVSVCFLLAANDVVKAFVWSPHTQMFNILVPVFALWAALRASEGALLDPRFALTTGAITGIGVTAYPLFVIVVPCVFVGGLVALICKRPFTGLKIVSLNFSLLAALTLLPMAIWYVVVRSHVGSYFVYDAAAHGEVVWMMEAWQQGLGNLVEAWLAKAHDLLLLADAQASSVKALLVLIAVAALMARREISAVLGRVVRVALCAAVVVGVTLAFYASVGLVTWRLAYAALPAVIAAGGAALVWIASRLPSRRRNVVAFACVAIVLTQSIFIVMKAGPYS